MNSSQEGQLRVLLTGEEKQNLQQPWRSSLIVKLFEISFELHYFTQRLKSQWNPSRNMDCVDLGYSFFVVTSNTRAGFSKPCFRPSKATFSVVAIWVRLPELPIEFYSEKLLSKIGNRIGPLLCIDSRTYLGVRRNMLDCVYRLTSLNPFLPLSGLETLSRPCNMKALISSASIANRKKKNPTATPSGLRAQPSRASSSCAPVATSNTDVQKYGTPAPLQQKQDAQPQQPESCHLLLRRGALVIIIIECLVTLLITTLEARTKPQP
ncbi:hypothetical protein CRG98_032802 [Punica granatum]|uniref:Uncharacterized protein n=1 Tax=Punica granatum TaxID=22663 RepID=A0A2I0IS30_PUNGR|nr:hypothetical protein CRG98_032802 [Punica granatum]